MSLVPLFLTSRNIHIKQPHLLSNQDRQIIFNSQGHIIVRAKNQQQYSLKAKRKERTTMIIITCASFMPSISVSFFIAFSKQIGETSLTRFSYIKMKQISSTKHFANAIQNIKVLKRIIIQCNLTQIFSIFGLIHSIYDLLAAQTTGRRSMENEATDRDITNIEQNEIATKRARKIGYCTMTAIDNACNPLIKDQKEN